MTDTERALLDALDAFIAERASARLAADIAREAESQSDKLRAALERLRDEVAQLRADIRAAAPLLLPR